MKPRFLLYIDLSGITNCNTFSVVPSMINENAKSAVPFDNYEKYDVIDASFEDYFNFVYLFRGTLFWL